jgi:hypothetical protein
MVSSRALRILRCAFAGALFFFSIAQAKEEKTYVAPPVVHARTYPGHQEDSQDNVTVAVDPYDSSPKSDIFTVDYLKYGLLPVLLIVSNDGDQAISLKGLKAELVTGSRIKLEALREDEIMQRLFRHGEIRPHVQGPSPLPIPLPHKSKTSDAEKAHDELGRARFNFLAVEPHTTRAGFLFFDSSVVNDPITGSYVYVNGVHNAQGQELLYFELSVEKAEGQGSTK